ncbi:MAG: type IV pilus twitching motility protein PilT [Methylacidiphilales bacterium]|nr:type IV pilus twitching motility protein PilT [Candidatus Methylacidiphilales bacterium]MDW8349764.1 type IV pilus twitching motility protein PilT [Verrucomicrobiae bacterium]
MAAIDFLFQNLIEQGGSDLHLAQGQPPKIRIHGDITPIREAPVTEQEIVSWLSEICGEERWKRFLEKGDLDFAYEMSQQARFRCNYLKHYHGIGAVFRLIPTRIATIEELNLPPVIRQFAHFKGGLVLVTGPTGSGKSTSLAALIDYINTTFSRHIVTIEEPIEFVHDNKLSIITQREVPEDVPSFSEGLRAALREDADVVLVGEMRDLETISLALTAAETGLLVFGTLHTNNARKTVDRIIDVFPAQQQPQVRTMLASSLRAIMAQLLLKKADGSGRIAVNEIMIANPAVASAIREGATEKLSDIILTGRAQGMQFMDDAIMAKLKEGLVTPHEAYMKAIDKQKFAQYL